MRATLIALALLAASGCAPTGSPKGAPTVVRPVADGEYRRRDASLAAEVEAARRRCGPRLDADADCVRLLRQLRDAERELFADVRVHRFEDVTESNYWHRGRLKFPSELAQLLEQIDAAPASTVPGVLAEDSVAVACPEPVTVDQTFVGAADGWLGFGWVVDGVREIPPGSAARSSNHHPSAIDLFDGPPTELSAIPIENPSPDPMIPVRWVLPSESGHRVWMVCRYSGTYLTLGRPLPPGIASCQARFEGGRVLDFSCR